MTRISKHDDRTIFEAKNTKKYMGSEKQVKYYKLTDLFNLNDIVKETDDGNWYDYYYGDEKWVQTGIMIRYEWPDDVFYDQYIVVSEEEAMKTMEQNRKHLLNQLSLAEKVASEAHKGQFDKGGNPYIGHPRFVADSLQNIEHKVVALLHDVCEDSSLTMDDLQELGFSWRIAYSVSILTRGEGISYDEYLAEIKRDGNARAVKIADIKHNIDLSRIANPKKEDYERVEKYKEALEILDASRY